MIHMGKCQERLNGGGASGLLAVLTGDTLTCLESEGEPDAMAPTAAFPFAPPGSLKKALKL